MSSTPMPHFIQNLYSRFPLYTYPENGPSFVGFSSVDKEKHDTRPTLYILPPKNPANSMLSADVECVKWQAYLALRGLHIKVRWDLAAEGALDGRLPNLYLHPSKALQQKERLGEFGHAQLRGELLESRRIPSWVDGEVEQSQDDAILEGYRDEETRDESRAWISLLEGDIHAALKAMDPKPSPLSRLTSFPPPTVAEKPLLSKYTTGISSIITPFGSTPVLEPILDRYSQAMEALSLRLGTDKWFLSSRRPTALDAVAFAYVSAALQHPYPEIRETANKWVNLVVWEQRVRKTVTESIRH